MSQRSWPPLDSQLKPGGLFVSKTVCLGEANFAVRALVKVLGSFGLVPNLTNLSQVQLEALIQDAGFEIESIRNFGSKLRNPFIVARMSDRCRSAPSSSAVEGKGIRADR